MSSTAVYYCERGCLKTFGGKPFKILTDFGYATVLPPEYANEVRSIDSLSHVRAIAKVWFGGSLSWLLFLFFCYNAVFPLLVVRIYTNTTLTVQLAR